MWNCRIVGGLSSVQATVSAVVDAVDAPTACDAAVRASSCVASLFKEFGASGATPKESKGERVVAGQKTEEADLPTYQVEVSFLVPGPRVSASVLVTVQAFDEPAAIALACAKLGRALSVKLELVEFRGATVVELAGADQPSLFSKDPDSWPLVTVPPGTPPGFVCRCGHAFQRHELKRQAKGDTVWVDGLRCHACSIAHALDPKVVICGHFKTRGTAEELAAAVRDYVREEVFGAKDEGPQVGEGGVLEVDAEPTPAKKARRRGASGKEAAAGEGAHEPEAAA